LLLGFYLNLGLKGDLHICCYLDSLAQILLCRAPFTFTPLSITRNIFECDQSNVLLARIIFFCIF